MSARKTNGWQPLHVTVVTVLAPGWHAHIRCVAVTHTQHTRTRQAFELHGERPVSSAGAAAAMLASSSPPWWHVPIAGGIAGMTVDLLLFRLDTIKTRLQSRPGAAGSALPAGRFYRGIATQLAQSFPSAAVFFFAYDRG